MSYGQLLGDALKIIFPIHLPALDAFTMAGTFATI